MEGTIARRDLMIDLETLDTKPSCVMLSIGACTFEPETGKIFHTFYGVLTLEDQLEAGRTISESTLRWWMQQGETAKEVFDPPEGTPIFSFEDALKHLNYFIDTYAADSAVWSNGATFDVSVLEHAYNYKAPWNFWNVRDVRTIVDLAGHYMSKGDVPFKGTPHHALDDAIHQAKFVSKMYQFLKGIKV